MASSLLPLGSPALLDGDVGIQVVVEHEHEHAALVCSLCREVVDHLFASQWTVVLPTGEVVHRGDLICEDCQRDLRKRFSDEQTFTRPEG